MTLFGGLLHQLHHQLVRLAHYCCAVYTDELITRPQATILICCPVLYYMPYVDLPKGKHIKCIATKNKRSFKTHRTESVRFIQQLLKVSHFSTSKYLWLTQEKPKRPVQPIGAVEKLVCSRHCVGEYTGLPETSAQIPCSMFGTNNKY